MQEITIEWPKRYQMFAKLAGKNGSLIHFIFRIMVGLLFMQHGAQKLFGWFGDKPPVEIMGLMGLAGIIEFFGGLAVALGLFTRFFAFLCAGQMMVAYFMAHFPKGWVPIQNRGELALLYFASFLALFWLGGGKWSLENKFR